jgi:hypothetical protein
VTVGLITETATDSWAGNIHSVDPLAERTIHIPGRT